MTPILRTHRPFCCRDTTGLLRASLLPSCASAKPVLSVLPSPMADYPCAIPSLATIHPPLAQSGLQFPEIASAEAQGANLRPAAVNEARLAVDVVEAVHQQNPAIITLNAVNDAHTHTRRTTIENIHGMDHLRDLRVHYVRAYLGGYLVLVITPFEAPRRRGGGGGVCFY
ncbi:hypothetical protein B0H15DRAFT_307294 [Mycena belliarum]|uniref:Uncharacterized protein n=1 Tax=Mycena belliarum TaxID=1033014 RepID=A0AAD6U308_9AGAR|nr:hypothetical protein B0H15DRAFT_307294 [Mycena belliae]